MRTFRQPLSPEEEQQYLQKVLQGDLEARNHLVIHNMRLVAHIVKKYHNYEKEAEDLISVGTIGLIKAIDTFNPQASNRLVTYASKCIENEILMLLRYKKKSAKDISIYEPIGSDKEGNEIQILDVICEPEIEFEKMILYKEGKEKLYDIFMEMKESREKYILIHRYGLFGREEMTQREIAGKLGISRSYVSRIEKKALENLRKKFEKQL